MRQAAIIALVIAIIAYASYAVAKKTTSGVSAGVVGTTRKRGVAWWPPRAATFHDFFMIDTGVHNCQFTQTGENRPFSQCLTDLDLSKILQGDRIKYVLRDGHPQTLNFRTKSGVMRTGFIGISIEHIPHIPGEIMWTSIWLMSTQLPPEEYCEVDIYEMMGRWWPMPKMSIHSREGCGKYDADQGNCGLYLSGCAEHCDRNNPYASYPVKSNESLVFWDNWVAHYNDYCKKNGPVSWCALIFDTKVLIGFSLKNWQPTSRPTVKQFNDMCDFVMDVDHGIKVPSDFHFLINSTYETVVSAPDLHEAYWKIPTVQIL